MDNLSNLACLANRVKGIELANGSLADVVDLSELLFDEWKKIHACYKNKLPSKQKINFEKYEAEEEIIISLLCLLNEKLLLRC